MNRELRIREVENGYVVEWEEDDEDGKEIGATITKQMAYQVREEDTDALQAFQDMLWEIISYFGLIGSKHDSRRLRVEIREHEALGADRAMNDPMRPAHLEMQI